MTGSEEESGAFQRGGLWEATGIFILKTLTWKKGTSRLHEARFYLARMVCQHNKHKVSTRPDTRAAPILPYIFICLLSFWNKKTLKIII